MRSAYDEGAAAACLIQFQSAGEDLALRVYSSRLIGAEPNLVMHGGGNTSVKGEFTDIFGARAPALFVKGSGWNLDSIAPAGFATLDLDYIVRFRSLPSLSDDEMMKQLRAQMFDPAGPTPSVETLLHAFLPHKFIDHSHADVVLAITNRRDGVALASEVFGGHVTLIPYVMPGFELAVVCANAFEQNPAAEGLVLLKHGLVTFGETARESYERHLKIVTLAENWLHRERATSRRFTPGFTPSAEPAQIAARVAPILRGLLAGAPAKTGAAGKRMVTEWRATEEIMRFVNSEEVERLALTGPLTPDHVIRTKAFPLLVRDPDSADLGSMLAQGVADYRAQYDDFFSRMIHKKGVQRVQLDSLPRVVLVPGAGLLAWGEDKAAARIAADIAEHTLAVKTLVFATGEYEALPEEDLFDMEYWPLEQAKLRSARHRQLQGRIAVVTGAAGAIGSAVSDAFLAAGANVVLSDVDGNAVAATCVELTARHGAGSCIGVVCDVTDEKSVEKMFFDCVTAYGGVDIIVPNAGVAHSGAVDRTSDEDWKRVLDVNLNGCFHVIREGARLLKAQGIGGHVIVIGSKNVMAPGAEFAGYSASKAAVHQLAKVTALELAPDGVRVNIVAPDAVFGEGQHRSHLWDSIGPARAKAHGIEFDALEAHYVARNLLKARITGAHVANAVMFFATDQTPTTGATMPVDGGIAAAFPR